MLAHLKIQTQKKIQLKMQTQWQFFQLKMQTKRQILHATFALQIQMLQKSWSSVEPNAARDNEGGFHSQSAAANWFPSSLEHFMSFKYKC